MAAHRLFGRFQTCALSALATSAMLAACGGSAVRDQSQAAAGAHGTRIETAGAGGEAAAGNAGADEGGAAGDATSLCPPGLPSAAEIASTPRADQNLELLALRLTGGIVADQAIYDRVVRDVTAIRGQDKRVAGIGYFARGDGKSLGLTPDAATYAAMHAGEYRAWDCLNQSYVVTDMQLTDAKPPFDSNVLLTLKGIYNIETVAAQYGAALGVKAYDGSGGGDGPTICVTRESELWHYVFDQAGGDCPAGCTEHTFYHFSTTAAGAVASLGEIPDTGDSPYTSNEACR